MLLFGPACNADRKPVPAPPKIGGVTALAKSTGHRTFTDEDYAVMVAAVDRILPRDEDPGALDADVPVYVDSVLQTPELRQMRVDFVDGLAILQKRARGTYAKPFTDLAPEDQDTLLTQFKDAKEGSGEAQFYTNLLTLTLEGFLGDPAYGGNKNRAGWALVGFDTYVPNDYQPLPAPPGAPLVKLKTGAP